MKHLLAQTTAITNTILSLSDPLKSMAQRDR